MSHYGSLFEFIVVVWMMKGKSFIEGIVLLMYHGGFLELVIWMILVSNLWSMKNGVSLKDHFKVE